MRYAAAWFGQAVVRHITGAAFARAVRWEAAETHVLPARQHNRPAVEHRAAQYVGTHAREDYPLRDTTLIVSGYVDRTTDRCVGGQAVDVYRLTGQTSAYRRMVDRQTMQPYVAHLAPVYPNERQDKPPAVTMRSFVPVDSLRRVGRLIEVLDSLAAHTVEIEAKYQTLLRYQNQQK
jgi:hypothetical protein